MDYIKLFQKPAETINYTEPIEGFVKPTIHTELQDGTAIPTQQLSEKSSLPEYLRPFALQYPGLTYEELVQKYNEYIQKEKPTLSQGRTTKPNAYEQEQTEIKKRQMEMQANEQEQSEQKEEAIKTIGALGNLVSPSFYLEQTGVEMTPIEKFLADYILDPTIYLSGGIGAFKHFNPSDVVRLERLLKNNMVKPSNHSISEINTLKRYLNELGVDVSKFNDQDFNKMLSIREANLHHTAPDVYNVVSPTHKGLSVGAYDKTWSKTTPTGLIYLDSKNGNFEVSNIFNLTQSSASKQKIKGISEQLYNASISVSDQLGKNGIISGGNLLQPEKTVKVLDKFTDKKQIGNNGLWHWDNGNAATLNNPVYMLNIPTYETPVKSVVFNPNIINHRGQIKTNWNNKNIYK